MTEPHISVLAVVQPAGYRCVISDERRLCQVIELTTNIPVGDADARAGDVVARLWQYFLGHFASAESKKGGEFPTARCLVCLLLELLEPLPGQVCDPWCGLGWMFFQSVGFSETYATGNSTSGRARAQISVCAQQLNCATWQLAEMDLDMRGTVGRIKQGLSFHDDRFSDLKTDFILANPPSNTKDWSGERLRQDKRWKVGLPPVRNTDFACIQNVTHQ